MKWSIPEKVVERGRTYLQNGRVLSVLPDINHCVWHAEVLGSELYLVDLDGTAKEEDTCQCPYWHEHGYCKHTVAVELYLKKKNISRIMNQHTKELTHTSKVTPAEIFTRGFDRLQKKALVQTQPIVVDYVVEAIETNTYHPELAVLVVSIKVGYLQTAKKTYVVKNIFEFLQAYSDEQAITLNKQHTFHLQKSSFQTEDQLILQTLANSAQTQQLLGANNLHIKGKVDKRYLPLPLDQVENLLTAMDQTTRLYFKRLDQVKRGATIVQSEKPLKFSLEKQENKLRLSVDRDFDLVLTHYHLGMIEQIFYRLSSRQQVIYMTLNQLMKRFSEPYIEYDGTLFSELFKKVLPILSEIGEIRIADSVESMVTEKQLETHFYFRKSKGKIQVRVDFRYGDERYSTDEKYTIISEQSVELLRDIQQEKRVFDLFPLSGYQKNKTGFEKTLPTGEGLYNFFRMEIPIYQQFGEVLIGKKLRELFLDAHAHKPEIEVREKGSWLDIHFDISGIEEQEINQVLKGLLNGDAYYVLSDGKVLSFDSDVYQETSKILQQLRQTHYTATGSMQIPKNQGLVLEQKLQDVDATFDVSFTDMVQHLVQPETFAVSIPKGLQATMREYQVKGFQWLKMLSHYQFGGILADEMGLGKTIQTIAYLLSEKEDGQAMKALIIAPASLIYNWQAEVKKFAPDLTFSVINGTKKERENQLETSADILITSYASLRQDIELYREKVLSHLVLDEAQMVKNSGTKTAQALRGLIIPKKFALSGTPIENNLEELWSLFATIMPGYFPTKTRFKELETNEVTQMIQPFVLRREKQTVLQDLPDKIETNLYSILSEEQKTVYLAYLRQMRSEVSAMDTETFRKNRIGILAGLTRLRQICCDPRLFLPDYQGTSGKLEQVKDMVLAAKENKRRVLLFSQFTGMLSIIEKELAELGIETFYLRGSTKPEDRLEMVDAFNEGDKDVFLISLKAGGTGLNLTGADTVILYDLWWNPAVEEQAAGRAHRIGQKKTVEVWRMISEGTIEERMDLLQTEKRELFQRVIQGNNEQLSKLTEEDIRVILSIGDEE